MSLKQSFEIMYLVQYVKKHRSKMSLYWTTFIAFSMNATFTTPRLEMYPQITTENFPNFTVGTIFCGCSAVNGLHHTLLGPSF